MALDPRAKFRITADGSDYKRKLKEAQRQTNTFSNSVRSTLRVGALAGAAAVTAAAASLINLASNASKSADALAKQSAILGITTQKLAAYQLAARLSGSTNEGFEKGIKKLQKAIVDATDGMSTYTRAFEKLRLDPAELKEMAPTEQFEAVGKALAGVTNQSERLAIAYDIFGGRNTALLNTLVLTGTNLNKLEKDTKAWGVAITRVDAKQLENANDAAERASTAMQGIGTSIALAVAPLRGSLANAFADSAAEANGFRDIIQDTMEALVVGANFAGNTIRGIALAFLTTKLAALQLLSLVTAGADERQAKAGKDNIAGIPTFAQTPELQAALSGREEQSTIDKIDETGRAIDELIGKFQSGDQALTNFRNLQVEAAAAAAEEVAAMAEDLSIELFVFDESFLEREQDRQDQLTAMREATAQKRLAIEKTSAKELASTEQKLQALVTGFRQAATRNGIALLQQFGAKNKAFARAAIIFEKAQAIARIIISTKVAAAAALTPPPIGLGPVAGQALAAAIKAGGAINAASVAALGFAQVASVGQGSSGVSLGTPSNPFFTDSAGSNNDGEQQGKDRPQVVINLNVSGDINGEDSFNNLLERSFSELMDKDVVVIPRDSRQAIEIRTDV